MSASKKQGDVSLNVFDLIDSVCGEFRRQSKLAQRPKIEDYLQHVPEEARTNLFRNLLKLEVGYRRRADDAPSSDDYLDRFPKFRSIIHEEFDEYTLASEEALNSTPAGDFEGLTDTYEMPAANRLGEYELIRELGRGGFGVVYEAKHMQRGNRVALKTLPTGNDGQEINADRLHKFRREFRTLSEINHPNLVGMQTLEVDGSQWFFTMDLIEGSDFFQYVRPGGQLNEARLRQALKQLVKGVCSLHDQRILHRDLKPSNVLVTPEGRVAILDFGLVAELERQTDQTVSMQPQHFAGTPRYAAPEQALGQRLPATDWYAVGTMLFEALTGEPPFRGTAAELLIRKREEDAPSLAQRNELPPDLAALTDALLQQDPGRRPDAQAIAEALGMDLETTSYRSGESHDSEMTQEGTRLEDTEIVLIGRDKQLAQLEQAKQQLLRTRRPVVVWISGRSGEGKSSLADKFLRPLRGGSELLVLSGRCYDRESVPFKAVDCLIEPLVAFLRSGTGQPFTQALPVDMYLMAQLFPELNRVEAIARLKVDTYSRLQPEEVRARGFAAFRELLKLISSEIPLALLIDDLQWGDADSAEVVLNLLGGAEPPTILLLGSFRSDEADDSSFLQTWRRQTDASDEQFETSEVHVAPLTREQCIELAAIRTGADQEWLRQQADDLLADTAGNPYFVEQLLSGFDPQTKTFRQVSLAEIISSRLAQLPRGAADLLRLIAVSGQPISIDEACSATKIDQVDLGTLTRMRSEQLVRLIGAGEQSLVDTYHDKVRESVLDDLSTSQLKTLHRELAETIESREQSDVQTLRSWLEQSSDPGEYAGTVSARVFDLAHHFTEARDPRAFVYQLLAGEQALQAYALEEALKSYQSAQKLMPQDASSTLRFRFWMGFARVVYWNKDFEQTKLAYQTALESATNSLDKGKAYSGLAKAFRLVARYAEGMEYLDQALDQFRMRRSKTPLFQMLSFQARTAMLLLAPPSWRREKDDNKRQVLIESHLALDSSQMLIERSLPAFLDAFLRSATIAVRTGEPRYMGLGYAWAGFVWSSLGIPVLPKMLLNRSASFKSELADPRFRGLLQYVRSTALYWQGEPAESKIASLEAIDDLSKSMDSYEKMVSTHMIRHSDYFTGSSTSELETARQVLAQSTEMRMTKGMCWGNYDMASALSRQGQLAQAVKHIKESYALLGQETFIMTEPIRASTDAYVRLQCSDYAGANERASFSWRCAKKEWMLLDVTLLCLPLLIESRAGGDWGQGAPDCDKRALRQSLRPASLFYPMLPNHQPHLLRAAGRAYYVLGRTRKAVRKFEKAIRLAESKGMNHQRARSLLDLAAIKEEDRDQNRLAAVRILKDLESVIPRAESWQLGDQYDEAVVAPEFDLEAWEAEHGNILGPTRPTDA